MNEKFQKLGFYPADILLPKDADMTKWAVVACDQFTSQPEYWQAVEETVGGRAFHPPADPAGGQAERPGCGHPYRGHQRRYEPLSGGGRLSDPAGVPVLY